MRGTDRSLGRHGLNFRIRSCERLQQFVAAIKHPPVGLLQAGTQGSDARVEITAEIKIVFKNQDTLQTLLRGILQDGQKAGKTATRTDTGKFAAAFSDGSRGRTSRADDHPARP